MTAAERGLGSPLATWARAPAQRAAAPRLRHRLLILFAFIGTFTYVNFVLVARAARRSSPMALGFVYFVFLPSIFTTPLAGRAVAPLRHAADLLGAPGRRRRRPAAAAAAEPAAVLAGLALVGVGTFFAQATATGFVGRAATADRGSASGIYLACYFFGGLVGTAVLGQVFDRLGWAACVAGIGAALALGAMLARGSPCTACSGPSARARPHLALEAQSHPRRTSCPTLHRGRARASGRDPHVFVSSWRSPKASSPPCLPPAWCA